MLEALATDDRTEWAMRTQGIDLMNRLLTYDPAVRITVRSHSGRLLLWLWLWLWLGTSIPPVD